MTQTEKLYNDAMELPGKWETGLFGHSELYKRSFLAHIQRGSNSKQCYYIIENGGRIDGGIVSSLKLRATRWLPPMSAVICRYPLSLPTRGYSQSLTAVEAAVNVVSGSNGDLKMIICDDEMPQMVPRGWTVKNGMPYAVFINSYKTFDGYYNSLKKNYRKSIRRSLGKFKEVVIRDETGADFSNKHYKLYRAVSFKAKYKGFFMAECFFTDINIGHVYLTAYSGNQIIGWVMLMFDGSRVYVPICGFDLEKNRQYDIWRNLHIAAIRKAFDGGYSTIDFGDTAEIGKARLGCALRPRYLLVKHQNKLLNTILSCSKWFEYKLPGMTPQAFKRIEV